jgi:hypothetical protein
MRRKSSLWVRFIPTLFMPTLLTVLTVGCGGNGSGGSQETAVLNLAGN